MADALADALASPDPVVELRIDYRDGEILDGRIARLVDLEELQLRHVPPGCVLPEELLALPKLRRLGLAAAGEHLAMPALVGRLPLVELDLWDGDAGDVPALPTLRRLSIVVRDPAREVAILADRLPWLTALAVWGSHLKSGELPDEVAKLSALEELDLVSCGVSTLPDVLAQLTKLRTLRLRGIPMRQLPEVVTRLPSLSTLEVGCHLATLPHELRAVASLRRLDLGGALNNGALVSRFDDISRLKPLPQVLGELTLLEELVLDHCGVFDVAPLRPLQALRSLSLSWSAISTLEDVAELSALDTLSLEHCDRFTDLSPLARLTKLRTLDLRNTHPATLEPLARLRSLASLDIRHIDTKKVSAIYKLDIDVSADTAILEKYRKKWALTKLPPPSELVAALASSDLATVQAALDELAKRVAASSTRGRNTVAAVLGVRSGNGALSPLDGALQRHLGALSPAVLVRTFAALFRATTDNFAAAAEIAIELARRGDVASQLALVEAFETANEHHDTGHRAHAGTVLDVLIDDVFPALHAQALVRLLAWCSNEHLDDRFGDHMFALFVPALRNAAEPERRTLLKRLAAFMKEMIEFQAQRTNDLWASLARVENDDVRAALERLRGELEGRAVHETERHVRKLRLERALESGADGAASALVELLDVPVSELDALRGALWRATASPGLSRDSVRALLVLWQRQNEPRGVAQTIMGSAKSGASELRADLASLSGDDAARAAFVRLAISDGTGELQETVLATLRVVASELDQLDPTVAASNEVRALFARAASRYDHALFDQAVSALSGLTRYAPSETLDESELATLIASMAENHEWEPLRRLARDVHKLRLEGRSLERILAQLVAVCTITNDREGLAAIEPLVPSTISWELLAYNLACKAAVQGDRAATFASARRALELGRSPDRFLADTDFAGVRDDPEFVALLAEFR